MRKFTIALLLTAAQMIAADSFVGEYSASMPEVGSGLLLKQDQSFEYFFTYGAADYTSKGSWRQDKGSVYLTTTGTEEKPFRVKKTAKGSADVIRVYVQAPNGQGVPHMDVKLTTASGELTERTTQDGVAEFPAKGMPKTIFLHVPVYDVEAGPFEIAPGMNDIFFEINGPAITTLRFKDEQLKFANGALELTYFKGPKPLRYRKR